MKSVSAGLGVQQDLKSERKEEKEVQKDRIDRTKEGKKKRMVLLLNESNVSFYLLEPEYTQSFYLKYPFLPSHQP